MFALNKEPGEASLCCTQSMVHAWKRGSNESCAMCPSLVANGHVTAMAAISPSANAIAVSRAIRRTVIGGSGTDPPAPQRFECRIEGHAGEDCQHHIGGDPIAGDADRERGGRGDHGHDRQHRRDGISPSAHHDQRVDGQRGEHVVHPDAGPRRPQAPALEEVVELHLLSDAIETPDATDACERDDRRAVRWSPM